MTPHTAESCWDTQWLSVWHNEAPVLSRKWYTCVGSHTSSPWDDVTNYMYAMIWHKWLNATVNVQLVTFWLGSRLNDQGWNKQRGTLGKKSLMEIKWQRCYSLAATYRADHFINGFLFFLSSIMHIIVVCLLKCTYSTRVSVAPSLG